MEIEAHQRGFYCVSDDDILCYLDTRGELLLNSECEWEKVSSSLEKVAERSSPEFTWDVTAEKAQEYRSAETYSRENAGEDFSIKPVTEEKLEEKI